MLGKIGATSQRALFVYFGLSALLLFIWLRPNARESVLSGVKEGLDNVASYTTSVFPKPEAVPSHDASETSATQVATPPHRPANDGSGFANDTLIVYAYAETAEARRNLQFFVKHALHDKATFLFVLNGKTDAADLIPSKDNIKVVKRANVCYDLGAYDEVLTADGLWLRYKRFILMNASTRGPFLPHWTDACWSDRFFSKLSDKTKLVGLTLNCWPTVHVQSPLWATDREGLGLLLYPPAESPRHDEWLRGDRGLYSHWWDFPTPSGWTGSPPDWVEKGINQCFEDRVKAVEGEISATVIIMGAGKKVEVMLLQMQGIKDYFAFCREIEARVGEAYDPQAGAGHYDGANISPFETIFFKTNRGIDDKLVENLSNWIDQMEYSSYDHC